MKSLSAQPLFPIRGKWEATSWWYTVTKSHQSSLGLPKRYRIGRQLRANLSIYPSTKLSLGYQSFRWYIYIYLFFFLSNPLISLFLFICASSCREVTYTFLIPFHDSIVGDICSNDDQDGDNPQEQATSIFESCDVRGELVIGVGVRSWTRFARSPRFYRRSKSLEIEKDPFPRVSQRRRKEAAPFSPTIGEIKGARAVSRESGLHYEREYAYVRLVFYPRRISSTIYPKLLIYIISFKLFFKLIRNQAYLFIL